MSKFPIPLAAVFLLVLVGCNDVEAPGDQETPAPPVSTNTPLAAPSPRAVLPSPNQQSSPVTSPNTSQATKSSPTDQSEQNRLISAKGIGEAKVGMTLAQLKQRLGAKAEFQMKSPFIVDFDAIAIVQAGEAQYYILYPAGSLLADTDIIEALVTDNPKYKTAQGVGPGTPLKQAEAVYGDATLSYNILNESREYAKFGKQPSQEIAFRVKAPQDQQMAGIYPSSQAEVKETKEFQGAASVGFVEVYCGSNCPPPSP